MTKAEFNAALAARLSGEELVRAMEYFDEIIADRMEDGMSEAEAVAGLGDINEIVREIPRPAPAKKKRSGTLIALTAIGSPLWLPLIIAALIVAAAVLLCLWVLAACIGIVLAACALTGLVGLVYFPFAFGTSITYAIMVLGSALICAGIALMLVPAVAAAAKGMARLTGWCVRRLVRR